MLFPPSIVPTDRYGVIYVITHRDSGKQYVGQTTASLRERLQGHLDKAERKNRRYSSHIGNALVKHGIDAFDMETLDWAMSKAELDQKETFWIAFLDTIDEGYNLKGGGAAGTPSLVTKQKIAKTLTGRKLPEGHPFTIKGRPAAMKGRKRDPEWNRKQSETMKARYATGGFTGNKGRVFPKARRAVICVETGQRFDSLSEAAQAVKPGRPNSRDYRGVTSAIGQAAKTGRTAYGFHWRNA